MKRAARPPAWTHVPGIWCHRIRTDLPRRGITGPQLNEPRRIRPSVRHVSRFRMSATARMRRRGDPSVTATPSVDLRLGAVGRHRVGRPGRAAGCMPAPLGRRASVCERYAPVRRQYRKLLTSAVSSADIRARSRRSTVTQSVSLDHDRSEIGLFAEAQNKIHHRTGALCRVIDPQLKLAVIVWGVWAFCNGCAWAFP